MKSDGREGFSMIKKLRFAVFVSLLVSIPILAISQIVRLSSAGGVGTCLNFNQLQNIEILNFHPLVNVGDSTALIDQAINEVYQNHITQGPLIISDDGNKDMQKNESSNSYLFQEAVNYTLGHYSGHYEHLSYWVTNKEERGEVYDFANPDARDIAALETLSSWGSQNILSTAGSGGLTCVQNPNNGEWFLKWKDQPNPIHLVGFTALGAVAAGEGTFPVEDFLNMLQRYHINFTRIFIVDPWANSGYYVAPFYKEGDKYNLNFLNQPYFNRLRRFVTLAAARGIIVQVTVFDRCGLKDSSTHVDWDRNPYNCGNDESGDHGMNINYPYFQNGQITNLNNNNDNTVMNYHRMLISQILNAIGDCRNVIYEIMNEPDSGAFVGMDPEDFHNWVADFIKRGFGFQFETWMEDFGSTVCSIGVSPETVGGVTKVTDGFDGEPMDHTDHVGMWDATYAWTCTDLLNPNRPNRICTQDIRPIFNPGISKVWNLRVGAGINTQNYNTIHLAVRSGGGFPSTLNGQPIKHRLTMVNNRGVSGAPANGTYWDLSNGWELVLPILRVSGNERIYMMNEGYVFTYEIVLAP